MSKGLHVTDRLLAAGDSLSPIANAAKTGVLKFASGDAVAAWEEAYHDALALDGSLRPAERNAWLILPKYSSILHEVIIPAFSWLERSAACSSAVGDPSTLVLEGIRKALQSVLGRLLRPSTSRWDVKPLGPEYSRFVLALLRTDALHCVARRLAALRQRVGTSSSITLPQQIDLLSEGRSAVQGAVELVSAAVEVQHPLAIERDAALASSHLLEHTCALFMAILEQYARVEALVAEAEAAPAGSDALAPCLGSSDPATQQADRERLFRQFGPLGSNLGHVAGCLSTPLVRLLQRAAAGADPGTASGRVRDAATAAGGELPAEAPQPHPHLLPALLHPAVQYFVGWAALGSVPGAAAGASSRCGRTGSGSAGASVPLLRDLKAALTNRDTSLSALEASATLWSTALGGGVILASSASPEVGAGGGATSAAHTIATPDGVEGPQAGANGPMVPTLPYEPTKLYGMLMGMHQLSVQWRDADRGVAFFAITRLGTAGRGPGKSLTAAAKCLLRLTAGPASHHLPALWRMIVRQITFSSEQPGHVIDGPLYEAAGQLLGGLAHLSAPGHREKGAGRGRGAPACGAARAAEGSEQRRTGSGSDADSSGAGPSGSGGGGGGNGGSGGAGPSGEGSGASAAPWQGTEPGTAPRVPAPDHVPHAAVCMPAPAACFTLSCALAAGLMPALEADVRRVLRSVRNMNELRPLLRMVELALRRPGCWPAMLAHGDLRQSGALVLTLRKAAKSAEAVRQQLLAFAAVAGLSPKSNVQATLRWLLLAVLEQLSPQVLWPQEQQQQQQQGKGAEGGPRLGPSGAPGKAPGACAGSLALERQLWLMPLNCSLSSLAEDCSPAKGGGARRTDSPLGGGGGSGIGHGGGSVVGGSGGGDGVGSSGFGGGGGTDMWQQVVAAGGCPAPGSREQQQLRRLGALAAAEWLPSLLTCPSESEDGRLAAVPLAELLPHGAYRVAWAWLRLMARQALSSTLLQPSGTEPGIRAGLTWGRLLAQDLLGTLQAAAVIKLALSLEADQGAAGQAGDRAGAGGGGSSGCGQSGRSGVGGMGGGGGSGTGGGGDGVDQMVLRAAVRELLPVALDVLEVLVVVMPQDVGRRVAENATARRRREAAAPLGWARTPFAPGWGPGLPWDEGVQALLMQQGRVQLAVCLDRLHAPLVDDELQRRREVESWILELVNRWVERLGSEPPELPGPEVDVGFARCAYTLCRRAEGASEAEQRLLLCGRCRAVEYCCPECQRADWAAGHKAACGVEGAGAGGGRS